MTWLWRHDTEAVGQSDLVSRHGIGVETQGSNWGVATRLLVSRPEGPSVG